MAYAVDEHGRVFGSFYWIAPADPQDAVAYGPPTIAYDREAMGDKQAYKAAKQEIKDLYKSMSVRGPRLKIYGSDFIQGVLWIERGDGDTVSVSGLTGS